jgi:hypothetical protein
MDQKQFDAGLSDAELRLRRLKMLYDQWFMGFERSEPATLRKELEDLLARLRKEQVSNTAQRFRLQQLVQRHTAFATHWRRIGRQIEEGTYQRDLLRAKRRSKANQRENNDPELELSYDVDVDLELEAVMEEANRVADAAAASQLSAAEALSSTGVRENNARAGAEPAPAEAGAWRELGLGGTAPGGRAMADPLRSPARVNGSAGSAAKSGENVVDAGAGGRAVGGVFSAPSAAKGGVRPAGAEVVAAEHAAAARGSPANAGGAATAAKRAAGSSSTATDLTASGLPSAAELNAPAGARPPAPPRFPSVSGANAPGRANASAGAPRSPSGSDVNATGGGSTSARAASASDTKSPGTAPGSPPAPRYPSASGVKAPPPSAARASLAPAVAPLPSGSAPSSATRGAGMAPRFPSATGLKAPAGPLVAARFPSMSGVKAPPIPSAAGQPAAASGNDDAGRGGRSISPFALPTPATGQRPALSKPPPPPAALTAKLPAAAAPARPRPRPVANDNAGQAAARPPAAKGGNGFSSDDVQRVYDQYLSARKQNAERIDNVKLANIEKTIRGMLPQLEQKHAGKKIDFEVVVRDGKVALKPVAK